MYEIVKIRKDPEDENSLVPMTNEINQVRVRMTVDGHVLEQDIDMGKTKAEFEANVKVATDVLKAELKQNTPKDVPDYIKEMTP